MYQQALKGYEKCLDADNATTYISALNAIENLGFPFESQADSVDAEVMCTKALVANEKFLRPYHKCCSCGIPRLLPSVVVI